MGGSAPQPAGLMEWRALAPRRRTAPGLAPLPTRRPPRGYSAPQRGLRRLREADVHNRLDPDNAPPVTAADRHLPRVPERWLQTVRSRPAYPVTARRHRSPDGAPPIPYAFQLAPRCPVRGCPQLRFRLHPVRKQSLDTAHQHWLERARCLAQPQVRGLRAAMLASPMGRAD